MMLNLTSWAWSPKEALTVRAAIRTSVSVIGSRGCATVHSSTGPDGSLATPSLSLGSSTTDMHLRTLLLIPAASGARSRGQDLGRACRDGDTKNESPLAARAAPPLSQARRGAILACLVLSSSSLSSSSL